MDPALGGSDRCERMRNQREARIYTTAEPDRTVSPAPVISFNGDTAFQLALRQRITAHFVNTGRRQRDCWQTYVKTVILLTGFAASYVLLVFAARTSTEAVVLAILLGLFVAGIGLNIQHDGGHRAYSERP